MSPQNRSLIVGLAAPGLLWLATSVAPGQESPPAPPGPPTPASSTIPSPGLKSFRALLLSNGKVVTGEITEDAPAGLYRLRQSGGSIGYPKMMVLKAGNSVVDLYRFQVARLPEGDPDERMKLARWCLALHLDTQAREQLEAIQAMCPGDAEVRRMLYNLAATAEVEKMPVDPALRRTSVEMTRAGEAPASLDPRVLVKARKRFSALPEILDLPQAQAVKRANEFADFVHPVVQQACARCHNEKYQGDFQLVEVKARRDLMNSDVTRANLDATLRLVNADDPARSELLSAGLVPHGGSKTAIFKGPNDRSYQILNVWVKSLRPVRPNGAGAGGARSLDDEVSRTSRTPGDGFASDRSNRQASTPAALPDLPGAATLPTPYPLAQVERIQEDAEFVTSAGDRPVFEAPYAAGGPAPKRPAPPRAIASGVKKAAKANATAPATAPAQGPAPAAKKATQASPNAVVIEATDDPNDLPGMDQQRYPSKKAEGDPGKKSKAIDGALLDKLMKARNGGSP